MKTKSEDSAAQAISVGDPYLTKRLLVSRAQSAGRAAAKEAMELMGYVVTVKDGWVGKLYPDGSFQKMKQLDG